MDFKIPAVDKLLDYTASGIGSLAGPILAPWRARREGQARILAAEADAQVLEIQGEAHRKARELVIRSPPDGVTGKVEISDRIHERVEYQEAKRLANIAAVVGQAAVALEGKESEPGDADHDWTARFFNDVQDISTEEMRALWARVLAGEVERPGSTSLRTLGILRDLDREVARSFASLCSAGVFIVLDDGAVLEGRVPSLGRRADSNALAEFGFGFQALNVLNEHGLIIADYHSWRDYAFSTVIAGQRAHPLHHQGQDWVLVPERTLDPTAQLRVHGVALTSAACELAPVIELTPIPEYTERLQQFFGSNQFQLRPVAEVLQRH